jgi:poly-D-alanine transfer protein DltD
MSTRCQIKVEGEKVLFYKHSDGYPDGVLPTLEDIVAKFKAARGFFDGAYLLARIGQRFMNDSQAHHTAIRKAWVAQGMKVSTQDDFDVTGYGYDTVIHSDIKYLYTVKKDWTITVSPTVEEK